MDVAVTGSSGLIGSALVAQLRADGHRVRRLVRRPSGHPDEVSWDPQAGRLDPRDLDGITGVVNLAGAGIGDRRWSTRYKRTLLDSRVRGTALLARTVAGLDSPVTSFVQGSACGVYGDRGDELLTEDAEPGSGFLAEVVVAWEAAAGPVRAAGIPVGSARTAIVLSPSGGAMGRLLPLLRLGLVRRLGPGDQFWAWITLRDEVRALGHLLEHPIDGPVNLCAPQSATHGEIITALTAALRRPAMFPVPAWALRLGLGEMASDLLGSQRAVPAALTKAGFAFEHGDLDVAARWVIRRS